MTACELRESPDIELYFYGELDASGRARVAAHLGRCEACRERLDDLAAIRRALAGRPVVDAPPAADWSGFMRRLDRSTVALRPLNAPRRALTHLRVLAAMAATLTIAALGIYMAMRVRQAAPPPRPAAIAERAVPPAGGPAVPVADPLREATAEHLERSKLVVLGLTALDPRQTHAADWQYERRLAGTLLDDTRLYREMAQKRGLTDVAHVMRDLETVLIETSMSDSADREALARVQRLIAKRDLVVKMQLASTN